MLKLKRYLKPYIALLLGAIAFLFGQAMLELTLPNYMSDIVNVGLQQGGITQSAPEAIDQQSMAMMQMFMSEEDRQTVNGTYIQLEEGEQLTELQKTYPNLKAGDYALIEHPAEGINGAFSRASYALVSLVEEVNAQQEGSGDMQEVLSNLSTMMMQPEGMQMIQDAIDEAAVTPESMISQTGPVMVKSFYQKLGADTDAIQTNYIIKDGLKMLGLTVLLTCCAIGAGFCLARMGAGVGRDLRRDVFTKVTYSIGKATCCHSSITRYFIIFKNTCYTISILF